MIGTREAIYAAIFARVVALKKDAITNPTGPVTDCSRKLVHWQDIEPSQMPFVCQVQMPEHGEYQVARGVPTKWHGKVHFVVYCSGAGDSTLIPAQQMNAVVDGIENAFAAIKSNGLRASDEEQGRCTLNHLVYDIRCFGDIELDDGNLGTQSVAIVPVEFIV